MQSAPSALSEKSERTQGSGHARNPRFLNEAVTSSSVPSARGGGENPHKGLLVKAVTSEREVSHPVIRLRQDELPVGSSSAAPVSSPRPSVASGVTIQHGRSRPLAYRSRHPATLLRPRSRHSPSSDTVGQKNTAPHAPAINRSAPAVTWTHGDKAQRGDSG